MRLGKFFTAIRRGVFYFAPQTVDVPSKSGLNYDQYVSGIVQYLYNQMGPHGRDPNIRGDIAVEQAKDMFIERGYPILGEQVESTIDGYPIRKYDFVVRNSDGSLRGVEVKSTIGEVFKLNSRQVAFDAAVYSSGAKSAFGTITSVGYVEVGMGNVPKYFQTNALHRALTAQGVTIDVITGLKVKIK